MRLYKRALCLGVAGLAGIAAVSAPLQSLAASPEFSRSAEEWERLRDNVLEYDEIVDLVHEYNATVRKNQIDLNESRKEYGVTNSEWADRYRVVAGEAEDALQYPDSDDMSYAAVMAGIIQSEMQIKTLREKADDALEDYEVAYYGYSAQECQTAAAAQSDMVSYYLNQLQLQTDQKNLELMQVTYDHMLQKQALGTATAVDVLRASENLRTAQKAIQDDESAIENVRQKLIVALGWSHDATPEIRGIPEVDMEFVASMNPEADKAAALENSYSLKADKKKLSNARAQDNIDTLQTTVTEREQKIGAALTAGYQSVVAAKAAYDLNVAQAALESKNLESMGRRYAQGTSSHMEYLTQENAAAKAGLAVETAKLKLFEAVESYRWMLNGLAGSEG